MSPIPRTQPAFKGRSIGPVADLERHLPDDWWQQLFNAIYLKTDGDVVENAAATKAEVDTLLEVAPLGANDRILDLCCGQGRHLIELAERGFQHLTGVDRSRYLVRLARRRARTQGHSIQFKEGDARKVRLPKGQFSAVTIMGNSFGYFASEMEDLKVLAKVMELLKPGGMLVLDLCDGAWMRQSYEPRSWEWIDEQHFVCRERSLSKDGDRLISREVVTHTERGVIADQFYAERLYDRERLHELLKEAGFEAPTFHDPFLSQSDRGQDLGMMAQRLMVTARTPMREVRPSGPTGRTAVTVLLGDPRLPDPVKRGGRFNDEDFETINKLKAALGRLDRYEFTYLDDHDAMIDKLRRDRPKLVFNLCDEGYQNDAMKELHVPALLEMLAVPYTGGSPSTLAFCYDKALVRAVASALDIPVPTESFVNPMDAAFTLPSTFPALMKPNTGDSSLGITAQAVVHSKDEMVRYMDYLRETVPGRSILVQEFLSGAEYSVAMIGNPGSDLLALPILEVDYSGLPSDLPAILGYESKWHPESPYWTGITYREAEISSQDSNLLTGYSARLFERLGCRDYARFDFRRGADGTIKLLEVNPNPGWCWDGKMNLMAEMAGYSYADFLRMVIDAAMDRCGLVEGAARSLVELQ
ncbi:MAG: methyltransferase domain-containing protein [Alphaproteobacteria bacterium]|nr:MAG: methyltransferase domain-containing protein [Alphaproteobacteria bacterium]